MASVNTTAQLDGYFKEVYGDLQNLVPDVAKLSKMVSFDESTKIGDSYHEPVLLAHEQGVTYASAGDGAYTLQSSVAMTMKDAQVQSSQITLRSQMDYETAAKAVSSKKAFGKATQQLVENMMTSAAKRLEISMFYGGQGIAQTASSTNTDTTHTVVQLSTASWAAGIWCGSENAQICFHKASDNTRVSSSPNDQFNVDSVDLDNRKITVSGTTTGISALDTAIAASTQNVYFYSSTSGSAGGFATKEMAGLDKIITNTGTLFNVNAGTFNLFKGNVYDVSSAALSMAKVLSALSKAANRGLDEKVVGFVNPDGWTNLATDLSALRKLDASYTINKGSNGFKSIEFFSQSGEIELIPHNIVKEGDAFFLPLKRMKRVGSQDISFKQPGGGDDIFLHLQSQAGFELRVWTDQAIFVETPARCVKMKNIVNS